ncbi:MAG: thermonuclease family protein [Oscillatoriales cyanobacterium RU_3_3]|nr:thermonuclease family protein [Microcoleus sp. SU_5_6]NJL66414.1 thermonuclease family protein [Microcoleus sp. SM1_3_4]NJM64037.1 thermonuclease family protein [Oscillatoriales cyanobacterium RU_3_3]NJR21320.1 thermonuclease family protein [Richelia sp. CSU_2_1]
MFVAGVAYPTLAQRLSAPNSLQSGKVVHIVDGDTVDVEVSKCRVPWKGNPQICRVRFACIDTPEKGQKPFFDNARNRIEQLIPVGTSVTIRDTGDTNYNRIVAEIYKSNSSLSLQMVREGHAVNYCRYLQKNCGTDRAAYLAAEAAAKQSGLGVWNPNQPWKQRRESSSCS